MMAGCVADRCFGAPYVIFLIGSYLSGQPKFDFYMSLDSNNYGILSQHQKLDFNRGKLFACSTWIMLMKAQLSAAQLSDPDISHVLLCLQNGGTKPEDNETRGMSKVTRAI